MFGAYLANPGADLGILVNNRPSRAIRRHSAAHELGHQHGYARRPGRYRADDAEDGETDRVGPDQPAS